MITEDQLIERLILITFQCKYFFLQFKVMNEAEKKENYMKISPVRFPCATLALDLALLDVIY